MHQTFYIDIDEEITSIVEKLKKARVKELIMVVPKRALLIQSIVNLRILKKEADEAGLQLMIVTQDKLGKILIEKAGILVQQKMDNIADEDIDADDELRIAPEPVSSAGQNEFKESAKTKNRLDRIGSSEYFNEASVSHEEMKKEFGRAKQVALAESNPEGREKILNKELVAGAGSETKKRTNLDMGPRPPRQENYSPAPIRPNPEVLSAPRSSIPRGSFPVNMSPKVDRSIGEDDSLRHDKINNFFQPQNNAYFKQKDSLQNNPYANQQTKFRPENAKQDYAVSGKIHKWFWSFGVVVILVVALVAAYLLIPKANVVISAKAQNQAVDSELMAETSASSPDYDKGIIPAKLITTDVEVSQNFTPSGAVSTVSPKAHGMITIYNTYSSAPQLLVATTRFLATSGKLFRLVATVTVPGDTQSGGQIKPGTISAEVEAEQGGADYNIGPDTFNLPGLKSSGTKYAKIYAKSSGNMSGGSSGTVKANRVTAKDISLVEQALGSNLDGSVKQKIKDAAGGNVLIPDGAVNEGSVSYLVSNPAGEAASSPQVTASVPVQALVVDQSVFNDVVGRKLAQTAGSGQSTIDSSAIKVSSEKADADFKTGTMSISFHATANLGSSLDLSKIKSQLIGKSESQLKAYLSNYPNIQKVEVDYWPSFISGRIPFWSKRVSVTLDSN
ncbi:MAG: hypothetical protein P4L62_02250 [Candidatus Pacebacteria bacterium]|nr:hypothetical protein [Candidatus Paceibacterota bacterium]MDR3583157.1 hypothetical protein [Candidatus Paceibacterota bacterium]